MPVATLDRICTFLGVAPGVLAEVPAENVTTQASDSWGNRALSGLLRAGTVVEHRLPERYWERIDTFLARHLQREQKLRQPLTPAQRACLLPTFTDDVRVLEQITGESFADWLDAHRPARRASLAPHGRIGTAHGSIDYPLGD